MHFTLIYSIDFRSPISKSHIKTKLNKTQFAFGYAERENINLEKHLSDEFSTKIGEIERNFYLKYRTKIGGNTIVQL